MGAKEEEVDARDPGRGREQNDQHPEEEKPEEVKARRPRRKRGGKSVSRSSEGGHDWRRDGTENTDSPLNRLTRQPVF